MLSLYMKVHIIQNMDFEDNYIYTVNQGTEQRTKR